MKLRNQLFVGVVAVCLLTMLGCATVKHGTSQPIAIRSYPAEAVVRFNGDVVGQTPTVVNLSRTSRGTGTLRIEKEGFEPAEVPVKRQLSGAFWGNLLLGPIGMGVDFISGGWANLNPKNVNVSLTAQQNAKVASLAPAAQMVPAQSGIVAPVASSDALKRLESLKSARDRSLISEKEFNDKKQEILRDM